MSDMSVGSIVVRGAFLTTLCSIAVKFVTFISQIALAWFLVPEDMGLVAIATAISGMMSILMAAGVRDVLVQQRLNFMSDASAGFWLALAMNSCATCVAFAIAPFSGKLFGEPELTSLIMIMAVCWPITAFSSVYHASLYRELRFGTVASIVLLQNCVYFIVAVTLASYDYGAYALILSNIPRVIIGVLASRVCAGRIEIRKPDGCRIRALIAPVFWLTLSSALASIHYYGTSMVLGIMNGVALTGLYYWGNQISSQAIQVLSQSLRNVFFPALTKIIDDEDRQYNSIRKSVKILMAFVAPICVLQILLAEPLIKILFEPRWYPAIDVVKWLSVGLISQPLYVLLSALLLARQSNMVMAALTGCIGLIVSCLALAASYSNDVTIIAMWIGVGMFFINISCGYVLFYVLGYGLKELLQSIIPALVSVVVAGVAGYAVGVYAEPAGTVFHLFAMLIVALGVSVVMLIKLLPEEYIVISQYMQKLRIKSN